MEITAVKTLEVIEQSQVNDARRQIVNAATIAGFDERVKDRIALLCTELGTNLIKHTPHGGQLLVQTIADGGAVGIEIYSIDAGNGMNAKECLVDGFSTAGTLGTGLGAVQRLADDYSVHSETRVGTVIQTCVWNSPRQPRSDFSFGGLSVPKKGELVSGDKYLIAPTGSGLYCLLVDGLGHGIEAAEAAGLAIKRFRENLSLVPTAMIKLIHSSLRGTRGAVGAVAKIDCVSQRLSYCGLGNIEGIVVSGGESKHLVSLNGTLGYEVHRVNEFTVPWVPGSILVMHSDGLSSKTFTAIDDVANEPAPIIAGWLYKQHAKDHDDATVMVLKQQRRA